MARPTPPTPPPLPAGGVAGEVRNIAQGTVQHNNGSTIVVTFRLEQHDPSAGRTSVVTARLIGSRAIGFAAEGDWVEVLGPASQGFVNVQRAVNWTSGAGYQAPPSPGKAVLKGCGIAVGIYLALQVLSLIIYLVAKT